MKSEFFKTTALVGTVVSATLLPSIAQSAVLDELIVTAQKREQNLQDVGISITAFSGDQMNKLGFTDSVDIVSQTPGIEASGYAGGGLLSYNIRGVGQNDYTAHQEAPVALYIDEAYHSSNITSRFSLFDIERAEILRGPQGTLFGRNSTGGLVHFITAKPTDEFEGFVDVTLGEAERRRVEAAVGGGLSDTVSGRLSVVYNEHDGLLENDTAGDLRSQDDYAVRTQLLIEPSDTLSVHLKAQYADEDAAAGGYSFGLPAGSATNFFGYSDADGDPYTISTDVSGLQTTEALELYSKITWDLDNFTLTSVTNYQDAEHSYGEDSDTTPVSIYAYTQYAEMEQFSQELRLNWEGDRHRSVVGLYYLDIEMEYTVDQTGDVFYPGPVATIAAVQDTTTWAIFGQTEIDLNDQLALILGLRYNNDEKDYTFDDEGDYFGFAGYTDSLSEEDFNARVQLNYQVNDDSLLYASWSRGIKSGGFNYPLTPVGVTLSDLPFEGETLTSYEIGLKSSITDTARLNVATFYYDYEDYQAFNIDPSFNSLLFNAEAEAFGAEVELVMNPVEGLDILLGASYLDSEVTGLTDAATFPTGKETPPLSPELTFNGLVRYAWPAFGGSLAVQADFNWVDDQKFNLATSEAVLEDSHGTVNLRVDYTTDDERWSGAIFVKNLTDEQYRIFSVDGTGFFGSFLDSWNDERWVGGNVRYSF